MSLSVNESRPVIPQTPAAVPVSQPIPSAAPAPTQSTFQTRYQSDGFDAPKAQPKLALTAEESGGGGSASRWQAQSDYEAILRDGSYGRLGIDATNLLAQHRGDAEYTSELVGLLQRNGQIDSVVAQTFGYREGDGLGEWRHPILSEAIDSARQHGGLLDDEIRAHALGYNSDAWQRMNALSAQPIERLGVSDEDWADGKIIDGTGQAHPPGTPLGSIPAVYPQDGNANGLIIHVNGIGNDLEAQTRAMQETADTTGKAVVGIHNGTDGKLTDLVQAAGDKMALSDNPARNALMQTVIAELEAGREVQIAAHSQGALITSGALRGVADHYRDQGLSDAEIEAKLSNVKVETFGGAAYTYPDGPKYVHYVNTLDVVAMTVGLGMTDAPVHPGKNARVEYFTQPYEGILGPHDYNNVYMPYRKDFDLMYSGG
jgi:hypothetical protein